MKNVRKFFSAGERADGVEGDGQSMIDAIYPILEGTVDTIVRRHWRGLLSLSPDDIVVAVWGMDGNRSLTIFQETIHREIAPSVRRALDTLNDDNLCDAQKHALHYLICGMMVYKMMFMTMVIKNRTGMEADDEKDSAELLLDMNVAGHA